ncbi:MAG: DUF4920 domain-containing protein [Saprospiraceae bacterium]
MKKYIFPYFMAFLTFGVLITACKSKTDTELSSGASAEKYFGEKIDDTNVLAYDSMLVQLKGVDSLETKVEGVVSAVCQTKGCWMDIISDKDSTSESIFVEFKDYAFFMPKDLAGKKVVIQGKAYREVTPIEDLKHYAEDEGKTQAEIDKITEPKEELKFMASGVMIKD